MIKRVNTAKAVPPRRGLLPRLRNVRIRSKLGLILIIPIVALVGLAVVRLAEAGQSVIQAEDAMRYAKVSQRAAELAEQLQSERSLAAAYLVGEEADRKTFKSAYDEQKQRTDKSITAYADARGELSSVEPNLKDLLSRIDGQLEIRELDDLRDAVDARNKLSLTAAVFEYRILIANLIAYRESLAHIAGDAEAADLARAAAAISSYTEYAALEQVKGAGLLATRTSTRYELREFAATIAGQDESYRAFTNAAEERHLNDFQRTAAGEGYGKDASKDEVRLNGVLLGGKDLDASTNAEIQAQVQAAERYQTEIQKVLPGQAIKLSGGAGLAEWVDAMTTRVALVREVEQRLDEEFQAKVQHQKDTLVQQLLAEGLTVLLVLFVAALIALLIARSMARSLRRLREGALAVAYESLPQSVARLRNPETLGELTPDQVAASVKDPVQVRGRDEIGQVSQAFNVVHREAVRIAAEQAALRANVATMFINLARRSQALVDRLIGHLDRLERGEEDPDRLAQLFQLDHLATRMRRNDENLLVLAGADSTRVQREPAPLSDVLRAAQSEVEQYIRIEFGIVDRDVEVAPHAVNDVVHLLAELFDNATSFSPPDTVVVVDARRAGDRAILQIEDRGIGISAEQLAELNTRLASPPLVDVAVSRMMGLVVVGRLATRHGIRVELRAARDRGTIADVILPAGALILPQRAGRQHTLGLPQARSPLALEGSADGPPQGWQPSGSGQWSPPGAPHWATPPAWDRPGGAPATPAMPVPDRFDAGAAMSGGLSGNGDGHLPRRRPGEQMSPDGQPLPTASAGTPGGPPNPADEVLTRRPAAGPSPRSDHASGPVDPRQPIHRVEVSMGTSDTTARPVSEALNAASGGFPVVEQPAAARPQPQPNGAPQRAGAEADGASAPAGRQATVGAATDPSLIPPNVDDTMELPIFREVESAWFRTKQPSRPAGRGGTKRAQATDTAGATKTLPPVQRKTAAKAESAPPAAAPAPQAAEAGPSVPVGEGAWQTAADDGWRAATAATAAADVADTDTTGAGLPKRVPMAQLVPGGVDISVAGARNRSPDAVRGLLSAYHRGVQRGRQTSARTGSEEDPGKEQA
ncbi:MAG: nitrate- and nitrite sensing domain-containing protein [Micromonosporaceae bacterium]